MNIAADMCIYTNHNFVVEILQTEEEDSASKADSKEEPATLTQTC